MHHTPQQSLWAKLQRLLRHHWQGRHPAQRALPPEALERLLQRVRASEAQHSGEIRLCIEAALPISYLWRGLAARQRAVMLFGKLRVWDTAHNNGVLIYLLLAERAIEIVADRGLQPYVSEAQWQSMAQGMSAAFAQGRYEDGLNQALGEVSAVMLQHFTLAAGEQHQNQLPDQATIL